MSALAYLVVFSTGECEDVTETVHRSRGRRRARRVTLLGVFLDATSAELFANASRAELVALGWDGGSPKTLERREWRGLNVDYTGADIEVRTAPLNPARPGVTP